MGRSLAIKSTQEEEADTEVSPCMYRDTSLL